jgi:hypothetical protein
MPSSRIIGQAQLGLVEEHGWSLEKVATTWHVPVEQVTETLSQLSSQPLPVPFRQVPKLPATPAEAQQRRAQIQQLYRQGWSIERLAETFLYYSESFLAVLCQQAPPRGRACTCGCGARLRGKQQYATPACRQRGSRTRKKAPREPAPVAG